MTQGDDCKPSTAEQQRPRRVLITGSEGTVGRILTGRVGVPCSPLSHDLTLLDRVGSPDSTDGRFIRMELQAGSDFSGLLQSVDVVIHGAWDTQEGILRPEAHVPANVDVAKQLLAAAILRVQSQPLRVIVLSSVNAHVPTDWKTRRAAGDLITTSEQAAPNRHNRGSEPGGGETSYGRSKLVIEAYGREAASRGLDVIVLRLGGVNLGDALPSAYPPYRQVAAHPELGRHFDLAWEDAVRVAHADLRSIIRRYLDAPVARGSFEILNVVSESPARVHAL